MPEPLPEGGLIREIDCTITATPTLWWLGHSGFVVRFANITFYLDPCLSDLPGKGRRIPAPLSAAEVHHADMILASHAHPGHLDCASLLPMLAASPHAKLVLPRAAAAAAQSAGIPGERTRPTDAGLRIEYFKENLYGRIYAVPSAHPDLDWTGQTGYPYLGYLIRFGRWTIYHAGDCAMYAGLADRLRPFNVNVALLPIGGKNFSVSEAAALAADIGADWVVPMHYGTFRNDLEGSDLENTSDLESEFAAHLLGHHPEQRFRTFQCGEKWVVPEE